MKVPSLPWTLMHHIYQKVIPTVHDYLREWQKEAESIPNQELRKQALMSMKTKTFHCEGGSIYGLLAGENSKKIIRFIVAYQTISDYLDNLCDQSTSQDPDDFRALHEAMLHAITPESEPVNYYRNRNDQDDGGYLTNLVITCQEVLKTLPGYPVIRTTLYELCHYYCDLQVYKHVRMEDRERLLQNWFERNAHQVPEMSWYEFAACTGSTLGIFCLVAYAADSSLNEAKVLKVKEGYFPWVQGLHIMLDYFIDQAEDRRDGELNFCFYYRDEKELITRLRTFADRAEKSMDDLPDERFHRMIHNGLIAIYLADEKVQKQKQVKKTARKFIRVGGLSTLFFYINSWMLKKKEKLKQ